MIHTVLSFILIPDSISKFESIFCEEANESDPQKKGAVPAEKGKKVDGEVQDGGAPVVDPEAASSPTDVAAKNAKPVTGDAQQKGAKPAEKSKKVSEDHESDDEVIEEAAAPRTKMEKMKVVYDKMETMKAKAFLSMKEISRTSKGFQGACRSTPLI